MKHSSGVWAMPLSWWSSTHRSYQTRTVSLKGSKKIHKPTISLTDMDFDLCLLSLLDDFPESTGIKRIIQALNANVWSNVMMKDGEITTVSCNVYVVYAWLMSVCLC